MKKGLVSIIIPYNKDRGWLDLAIQSVYDQTYPDIELLIQKSDNGVSYNINQGINRASGEFIKYLCEDDMLTPNSISDSVKAMKDVDFIHGNSIILQLDGAETTQFPRDTHPSLNKMRALNIIHGGTLMYRSSVFQKYGVFDETLDVAEEYDFNLKLLYHGAILGYCNEDLYVYRVHPNQKSRVMQRQDRKGRAMKVSRIQDRYK